MENFLALPLIFFSGLLKCLGNYGSPGNDGNHGNTIQANNLNCTYPDHYCNPTATDLIRKVEDTAVQSVEECSQLCKRWVVDSQLRQILLHISHISAPAPALTSHTSTSARWRPASCCGAARTDGRAARSPPAACQDTLETVATTVPCSHSSREWSGGVKGG